jgi:2-haloacid dehalogenase
MKTPNFVTFDCYDTLVEFPIERVTEEILGERTDGIDLPAFFADFERLRFETTTHTAYQRYRDVLRNTLAEALRKYGLDYRSEDGNALVAAVSTWGPYSDVPPALERLRSRCKLVIVSNSDDDIIAGNVQRIGVPIDHVITAEQVGAYKPSLGVFDYVLRKLECTPDEVLHVAQGFQYDIVPTSQLGWDRVWINRYGKKGDPAYGPYVELPDLSTLPDLLGL